MQNQNRIAHIATELFKKRDLGSTIGGIAGVGLGGLIGSIAGESDSDVKTMYTGIGAGMLGGSLFGQYIGSKIAENKLRDEINKLSPKEKEILRKNAYDMFTPMIPAMGGMGLAIGTSVHPGDDVSDMMVKMAGGAAGGAALSTGLKYLQNRKLFGK